MKEHLLINQPIKLSDLTFDDLYVEISDGLEEKQSACRLGAGITSGGLLRR